MARNRRLSFDEREKRAIERIEGRIMNQQASAIADRKVRLGLRFGELDFKNISDQRLKELERKASREERKKQFIKKGGELIKKVASGFKSNQAIKNVERTQPRGTLATSQGGGVFTTMESRNIHEGVGRNIWDEDKPKKTIWD